jgi:uncharacterized protein
MALSAAGYAIASVAAAAAGAVNALAGGGTLITFPVLTALGLPAVMANVTNTVALLPGYLGGSWAQRSVLAQPGQRRRLAAFIPAAAAGGLVGALLLFLGGEKAFRALVPWLILFAAGLLAFGGKIKSGLDARKSPSADSGAGSGPGPGPTLAIALASVYAGYFGAGASVISLAVLALALEGPLSELNAAKQAISLVGNLAAALLFSFSGRVDWTVAAAMAVSALAGGALGGLLAGRMKGPALRIAVVSIGLAVGAYYLIRG